MLKDNSPKFSNTPSPSHKKGTIKGKLQELIQSSLIAFQKQCVGWVDTSEEELNEQLGKTLSFQAKSTIFIFQQETIQKQKKGQNRKVDIGVFKHYADINPFYTIEAKRLTDALPKSREREYVIGEDSSKLSGGIERYKHNIHGKDLEDSAMVGYIQGGDARHWHVKINDWIEDLVTGKIISVLTWNKTDLLLNTCGFNDRTISSFLSVGQKSDGSQINLSHFFINLVV